MVIAGLLALGTGMAWADSAVNEGATAGARRSAASVSNVRPQLRGIDLNGVVFPVETDAATDIDLTQVDGAMFYEAPDPAAQFDSGIARRWMDGRMRMTAADYADPAAFDGFVPLVYGKLRADLPWYSLYAAAQAEGMDRNGDRLVDANLLIGWSSTARFGVETGYRHYHLKLVNFDQLDRLDLELHGPYATIYLHF